MHRRTVDAVVATCISLQPRRTM